MTFDIMGKFKYIKVQYSFYITDTLIQELYVCYTKLSFMWMLLLYIVRNVIDTIDHAVCTDMSVSLKNGPTVPVTGCLVSFSHSTRVVYQSVH